MSYVKLEGVWKRYKMGEISINAAQDVSFSVNKGELVIILGPSGSGKTTVLNLLGGMDSVSEGKIIVDGNDIAHYSRKELISYRRTEIGFVFQFYNLIQNLTAKENVELASQICNDFIPAEEILKQVGLEGRFNNFPSQLSGGEQQRVAIARALAKKPKLLLCDEPTGALDYNTGKLILKLLQETCRVHGMTVVIVTHNSAIAPIADRVIRLKNSMVSDIEVNENPVSVDSIEW